MERVVESLSRGCTSRLTPRSCKCSISCAVVRRCCDDVTVWTRVPMASLMIVIYWLCRICILEKRSTGTDANNRELEIPPSWLRVCYYYNDSVRWWIGVIHWDDGVGEHVVVESLLEKRCTETGVNNRGCWPCFLHNSGFPRLYYTTFCSGTSWKF